MIAPAADQLHRIPTGEVAHDLDGLDAADAGGKPLQGRSSGAYFKGPDEAQWRLDRHHASWNRPIREHYPERSKAARRQATCGLRSEERRVGKEGRSRWSP